MTGPTDIISLLKREHESNIAYRENDDLNAGKHVPMDCAVCHAIAKADKHCGTWNIEFPKGHYINDEYIYAPGTGFERRVNTRRLVATGTEIIPVALYINFDKVMHFIGKMTAISKTGEVKHLRGAIVAKQVKA